MVKSAASFYRSDWSGIVATADGTADNLACSENSWHCFFRVSAL